MQCIQFPNTTMSCCPHCKADISSTHRELKPQIIELRKYLLRPLYELCRADRGLTLHQIAELSDDPTRVRRHWGQLKHFSMIRKDGATYYATEHAKNVMNGNSKIPEAVATLDGKVIGMPEDAEYRYVWELDPSAFVAPPQSKETTYQPRLLPA